MEDMGIGRPEMPSAPRRAGGDDLDHEMAAVDNCGETAEAAQIDAMSDAELSCDLPRPGWNGKRIARLAYLVGLGQSANEISFDPLVAATPGAVYKMARRLDLGFRGVPNAVLVTLNDVEYAALGAEGDRRRMTPDNVAARVVKNCIHDKLFKAIIDG